MKEQYKLLQVIPGHEYPVGTIFEFDVESVDIWYPDGTRDLTGSHFVRHKLIKKYPDNFERLPSN